VRFAIATREEVWLRGRLIEQRLSHGEAFETERGLVASDACDEALVAACDAALGELRTGVRDGVRMRLVAQAAPEGVTQTITVTLHEHAIVTNREHLERDLAILQRAALEPDVEAPRELPLVWRNGSGAVLLHEAFGHPAEHEQAPVALPAWLTIENPLALRRASHRDVPLLRMTNLVAVQTRAPFALPPERVEVLLVDGGLYDPLTELVSVAVGAADLVEGDRKRPVVPFTIRATRDAVARSLTGASGETLRYPGVICSREGQELVVGSHAPLLITERL
jgi:predicted Zn-dependent protease